MLLNSYQRTLFHTTYEFLTATQIRLIPMPPSACCPPDFSALFARQIMQHARLHFSPIKSFETMKTRFPSRFCNSSMSKIINSMQLFLDSKRFHVTSWKKIQSQYLYTSLYFFNFARPLFLTKASAVFRSLIVKSVKMLDVAI